MFGPKKILLAFLSLLLTVVFIFPQPLFASQKQYFDYGPYYSASQVLGFSFSSFENLPSLKIPDNLIPAKTSGILPDSPFYFFEKVIENTQLTFTFDPVKKEQLRLNIAAERIAEAKTLMDQGKSGAASQALDDYGKTLEALSQNLPAIAQRDDPESQQLLSQVEKVASTQTVVATALSLTATPAQAENWTEAANTGKQILDKVAEARGEPAIPQSLSTGLQQLKEQGLISEEESNKLYSLKNRSEVREELSKLASSGGLPPSELIKLDTSVAKYYPDVQNQEITNWQIVELRGYQTLPQPTKEIIAALEGWQDNLTTPPSNDIKPYLWYNRASDLAKEVDLSNFSPAQQTEVAKSYPAIASSNPTYSPPPSPSPSPVPTDQSSNPSPTPAASVAPTPSPTPIPADPYLRDTDGALPGQPTYIIKQLGEGFRSAFTFDPAQKIRVRIQQAERRLAEAEALSGDPQKASLYESTLKAYQQTLADTSTEIKQLKDQKAAKTAAEKLEGMAARHEVVFEKGLLPPPAKNPQLISDVIKATEDAMDRSADILDRPVLPPALSSRLGDLKAQGLILEEEAEDLVRSNSREEARSKIRKLVEAQTFPLADAKKLDEAQSFVNPADYNQLTEVRKVEELQSLRSVQAELAQTPTLKSQATTLAQKEAVLTSSIDTTVIKPEDLGGKENLVKAYEKLASIPRPINGGQFGAEATPGAQPVVTPPSPRDAVLTTCPEGASFKQFEGCVWADTGKGLNDYEQYKCDGSRQYYSFATKKCAAYDPTKGYQEDAQPICPVGYQWNWPSQSCQTSTGSILPYPSPSAFPKPKDVEDVGELSKRCPEGSSFLPPSGCFWDDGGGSVYDPEQYRCTEGQYYSFEEHKCVPIPKPGVPYPKNTTPTCKAEGLYWNWSTGQCSPPPPEPSKEPVGGPVIIDNIKPSFVTPGNPLYFLKQAGERIQQFTAFTPQAREQVSIAQARERLAEAIDALKQDDEAGAKKALTSYTTTMQQLVGDMSKASLSEMAKNEISKSLAEESVENNLLLEKLSAWAPAEQDTAISAATSATILGVDKAADIAGEPPIPAQIKEKIEALPDRMISEEDKKKLLGMKSRVEARLTLGGLVSSGALTQSDLNFMNKDFDKADPAAKIKVEELKKLEEIATATEDKDKLDEKIKKNEEVVQKLQEFEKTFEVGKEIPADIRPYVRLTRISEVAQTIRPDIVRLDEFQNRKDVLLAVATLQEEFKPTADTFRRVEEFRRRNPNTFLPPDLARIEALSYSLGVRAQAGPCFLPTPPFAPNTPCPAAGAAIPITSYTNYTVDIADRDYPVYGGGSTTDKDGKPLVYGQGPKPNSPGVCPSGYHWMYDSGGWCMADSGSYGSSYSYTPTGTGSGYTPYSAYYTAPGAPPATYGYPVGNNSYPASGYSYSAPSYWGPASTSYTTNPPAGTVPGSGPKPTSPGQCPTGYHWMSDSGGWCMANGNTYVPPGTSPYSYPAGATTSDTPPAGGYNCGSQPYDPVTKKCKDGACPGGFNWDGSKCVASGNYYSPNLNQSSCGPGYYWDGRGCIPTSPGDTARGSYNYSSPGGSYQYGCTPGYFWDGSKCTAGSNEGSGWSDSAARSQPWCQPPSSGCGSNSYWDYGSCYCRSSSTYSGGGGPTPSNQCQGLSCGGGAWIDYSTCSCRYSGGSGTNSTGSTITCYPPSQGCPGGWYDYGTCSCKSSSYTSSGTSSGGGGSCPAGSHWMSENGGYCMSDAARDGGSTSSGSSGSSSGSCPSGYHWMDNSWCMSDAARDGGGGSGGGTSPTPVPTTTSTSTDPTPTSTSTTTTTSGGDSSSGSTSTNTTTTGGTTDSGSGGGEGGTPPASGDGGSTTTTAP